MTEVAEESRLRFEHLEATLAGEKPYMLVPEGGEQLTDPGMRSSIPTKPASSTALSRNKSWVSNLLSLKRHGL